MTDGWLFVRFLFWMALNWGIAIFSYYLIIRAFFPQAQLVWGMFGLGGARLAVRCLHCQEALARSRSGFGGAVALLTGDESTALAVH